MAEEIGKRLRRLIGHLEKLETNWAQTDEMMVTQIEDGLAAMRYGQYGGSFPDPTARTVFDVNGALYDAEGHPVPVKWRNHRPEDDRAAHYHDLSIVEAALERMNTRRQQYMSANNNIRDRLDPTDFCRTHWHLQLYEGHRRVKGDRCKICDEFFAENKREPTATEADFYHRHGRWPHKLVDPKERRAV